jgi:hypothetical protein
MSVVEGRTDLAWRRPWSVAELAEKSGVGVSTIQRIEVEEGFPTARGGNIDAVYKALAAAGVTFLPENDEGVGVRGKVKRKGK